MTLPSDILLVDDNPDNLRLLGKILENQGYSVRRTVSGDAALRAARVQPPDLILLDINMPEMNGYEVCQHLKSSTQTQEIPIVFISALDLVSDKLKAFAVGGTDYITKPFHESEVLARVKNQLTIQQQHRQLLVQNHQLQVEIRRRQHAEQDLQRLNMDLERQVKARTAELQLAFEFEATLKRITDQVRDTLDEEKILATAVLELAHTVDVSTCNASIYNLDNQTALIIQEYTTLSGSYKNRTLRLDQFPEIYSILMQKDPIQFCSLVPNAERGSVATLACPIFDEQGVLGDIWLANHTYYAFHEQDIRLVQQVANQCAIALRQARLYQAAQNQVDELARLNRLKDDFVSTVSHELRTPLSSIKAVSQILESQLGAGADPESSTAHPEHIEHYLRVLREECDREIKLINDLLYLSGIDSESDPSALTSLSPQMWLPYLVEPFENRLTEQQLEISLNIPEHTPSILTNAHCLERILTELLNNACKYTPPGEKIDVAVAIEDAHVEFRVSNSGIGIPPEERDRIFDKFYRIPSSDPWKHGGTGLGLALVKKLVIYLGGTITVEGGDTLTTFTVKIPKLTQKVEAEAER